MAYLATASTKRDHLFCRARLMITDSAAASQLDTNGYISTASDQATSVYVCTQYHDLSIIPDSLQIGRQPKHLLVSIVSALCRSQSLPAHDKNDCRTSDKEDVGFNLKA
jgi:hypothetical protein